MISRLSLCVALCSGFWTGSVLAICEESSRSSMGDESFFVVCRSESNSPVQYVLTKYISDELTHGILSFRAGRQGFFCASDSVGGTNCHPSNFGLIPADSFKTAAGYQYRIDAISRVSIVKNPDVSYPRDNRIGGADCYFALKDKSITLGINPEDPYGLETCLVAMEQAKKAHR